MPRSFHCIAVFTLEVEEEEEEVSLKRHEFLSLSLLTLHFCSPLVEYGIDKERMLFDRREREREGVESKFTTRDIIQV